MGVDAWNGALIKFKSDYDPDEEFIDIKGHMERKDTHCIYKGAKTSAPRPAIVWPVHMIKFLENYLDGLKRFKRRLRREGISVNENVFFVNIGGQLAGHHDLRTCLKMACEVFCIEFSPRFWRIYVETNSKERFEDAGHHDLRTYSAFLEVVC